MANAVAETASTARTGRHERLWLKHERILKVSLVALDTVALASGFALAGLARFANPLLPYYGPFSALFYVQLVVWVIPVYLFILARHQLYDPHLLFGGTTEYARVASACTYGVIVVMIYGFLARAPDITVSRGWLLIAWVLNMFAVGSTRFWFRRLVYRLRRAGFLRDRALILGMNEEALAVAEQLCANPGGGLEVVGFVGHNAKPGTVMLDGLRVVGSEEDLARLIADLDIHEVVVAPTAVTRDRLLDIHSTLSVMPDVHLRLSSGLFEILTTAVQVRDVGNVPLMSLNRLRITGIDAVLKDCMDYGLTIPSLLLVSPFPVVIAVLIKLTSPGPVIHRRRVLGTGGKQFDALKFRTMMVNSDRVLADMLQQNPTLQAEYEAGHKLKYDPRVTTLGRILRRYSLDELPQLLNVLKGEMSLVGPRMIAPEELPRYGKWGTNLLTVKPGLTGPWQVMGRNDLPYEERVRLSMHYIRNYSIWTDIKILFQTINVVIRGTGAY